MRRSWSASRGGGAAGDGTGEGGGFTTIVAPGTVGEEAIGHRIRIIGPARCRMATALGMVATGATGRRITGRRDPSIARVPARGSLILRSRLIGRIIDHRLTIVPPTIIGRRMAESRRFSRSFGNYARVMQVLRLEQDLNRLAADDELGRKLQDAEIGSRARAPRRKAPRVQQAGQNE